MKFDLLLMRRILRRLAREFPEMVETSMYPELDTPECHRVLFYLAGKKLVKAGAVTNRPGQPKEMLQVQITAAGCDWLNGQDESSKSLGEASSPFELEALRHFFKQAIEASDLSTEVKSEIVSRLLAFSALDVKSFVVKVLQAAAQRPEELVDIIGASREPHAF